MGAVLASGGVLVATYKHMQDNVVSKMEGAAERKDFPRKKKVKMSMKESAKFLISSPYIRDLAMLVISYGLCINIVEVSWKAKLKVSCMMLPFLFDSIGFWLIPYFDLPLLLQTAFPNPNDYSAFMGNFSSVTGAVTLVMMLLGRSIFAKFGWRIAALVTPTVSTELHSSF
jgi:AAA family ATP:ADP antiporter